MLITDVGAITFRFAADGTLAGLSTSSRNVDPVAAFTALRRATDAASEYLNQGVTPERIRRLIDL